MATYAAYRHVELDNVGYGKKRVLKPPGGGSSDIFGASADETSPRRVKSHQASQLGSALFGNNASNGPSNGSNGPETPRVTSKPDGNPVTGTGYGSDQQNNVVHNGSGNANSSGSEKSNDSSPGSGNMSNKAQRNRVPPGGYSSGLW